MEFNTLYFFLFFAVVFFAYWFLFNGQTKLQNWALLLASYVFYASWGVGILWYIFLYTIVLYLIGLLIDKSIIEIRRTFFFYLGLTLSVGGLIFFKYNTSNQIAAPLGISFFTFKTVGYLIDVYNGKCKAIANVVSFGVYVSFFPSIIAGPIDKSSFFVPQIEKKRDFNYLLCVDGARQILWGVFKKYLVADYCAVFVDHTFASYCTLPSYILFIGAFLNAVQLYADFSGYSDMVIGMAKMLGIQITKNFNNPFFAASIPEYWRRWHISLTSWITEYLFTPLSIAFRRLNKFGVIIAIQLSFVIMGLWHGANLTFVLFYFLHACYFVPQILRGVVKKKDRNKVIGKFNAFFKVVRVGKTFSIVMLTLIIFKSENLQNAILFYKRMLLVLNNVTSVPLPKYADLGLNVTEGFLVTAIFVFIMFFVEFKQRKEDHGLQLKNLHIKWVRWLIYLLIIFTFFALENKHVSFMYARF